MTSAKPGLSPADHAEITDLYAQYNLASDAGDAEAYAACFTIDGVLLVHGLSLSSTGAMQRGGELRIQGREALVAFKHRDVGGRNGRRLAVLWAPAFERGYSPFHLRDREF